MQNQQVRYVEASSEAEAVAKYKAMMSKPPQVQATQKAPQNVQQKVKSSYVEAARQGRRRGRLLPVGLLRALRILRHRADEPVHGRRHAALVKGRAAHHHGDLRPRSA